MMKQIVVLVFISITLVSCRSYCDYTPLSISKNGLIEDTISSYHKKRLIQVFKYYDVDWKLENDRILISCSLDKELLWNYTNKAKNEEWLKNHIK